MSGFLAMALLAAIPLLMIGGELRHMRAVMKVDCQRRVRQAAELKLAERILEFDDLDAYAAGVLQRVFADGLVPDRRRKPRVAA
ncbi:MAG TPA: hypothetical protein VIG97_03320 [Luteimonas sp.]